MSTISLDEYIEQRCSHLLFEAGCYTVPTDLERLAARLGVKEVVYEDMDAEGCVEGLNCGQFRIRLKASSQPNRRRFSFAHELGHIILDQASAEIQQPTYRRFLRNSAVLDDRSEEAMANTIAGVLLMPDSFVRRVFSGRIDIDLVQKVAERARVSLSAALVRAVQVSTRPLVAFQARKIGEGSARLMWQKCTKNVDASAVRSDLEDSAILDYLVFEKNPNPTGEMVQWEWVQVLSKEFDSITTFFGLAGIGERKS